MVEPALALVDKERLATFSAITTLRRSFTEQGRTARSNEILWWFVKIGESFVGLGAFGPGEKWEETEEQQDARRRQLAKITDGEQEMQLRCRLSCFRFGKLTARLLWTLHAELLRQRTSILQISCTMLRQRLWGTENRPKHWRHVIIDCLDALTWLHVSDSGTEESLPRFGPHSVLVSAYGAIGDTETSVSRNRTRPQVFQIELGPGFLGVLEACGKVHDEGTREYRFLRHRSKRPRTGDLRTIGKTGRLVKVFLPAKLGDPTTCERFSDSQHRMLQAVVRELTYARRSKADAVRPVALYEDGSTPSFKGDRTISAGPSNHGMPCVGFNGNGVRCGLGYKLNSDGGWLCKAGYEPRLETHLFLKDLEILGRELGLSWFAIDRSNRIADPGRLRQLAAAGRWAVLEQLHLRIYAPSTFETDWSRYFDAAWNVKTADDVATSKNDVAASLKAAMAELKISNRKMSVTLNVDPSFLSKVLRGRKTAPVGLARRISRWLKKSGRTTPSLRPKASPASV